MNKLEKFLENKNKRTFALVVVLLVGLGLRMYRLDAHGVWLDEQTSIFIASGQDQDLGLETFSKQDFVKTYSLIKTISNSLSISSGNAILYNSVMAIWSKAFGYSDFSVRILSVIFSILSIFVFYFLCKEIFKEHTPVLICCVLLMTAPLAIRYAQEARTYSFTLLLTLCSSLFFFRAAKNNDVIYALLFGLFFCLSFLGHYLAIGAFIIFPVFAIMQKTQLKVYLFALVPIFIGSLALFLFIGEEILEINQKSENLQSQNQSFAMPYNIQNGMAGNFQITLHYLGSFFQNTGVQIRYMLWYPLVLLSVPILFHKKLQENNLFVFILLALSHYFIINVLGLFSGHIVSFQPLYSIFCFPFFIILIVKLYSPIMFTKKHLTIALVSLYITIQTISLFIIYHKDTRSENAHIAIAQKIDKQKKTFSVTFSSWKDAHLLNLHLKNSTVIQHVDTTQEAGIVLQKIDGKEIRHIIIQ
tara:strand:- start:727 stop:2145 length:1419 start_codon:yes stop_codon:yes gene_type:complete